MQNIGGQAVIEGVMMKGKKGWTVAVRSPNGEIHVKKENLSETPFLFRLPIIRGFIALFQALLIGIKAIEYSANKAFDEKEDEKLSPASISITIIVSILLGIGLFILLPLYMTKILGIFFHSISKNSLMFNLVDGIIRVVFFILYIVGVGMWKEMRRIFEYHGAEHKVIHAYENGRDLSIKNIMNFSPLHPRCGTSFLLIVMVISIFTFSFIPQEWLFIYKFLSRIILIPLIAGISYEILKLSAKMKNNVIMHLFIQPGLLLQRLTTREPDESQIEVALKALQEVLILEEKNA
ncbi:MAG: DUF1385 domain-containing protein [Nitrospirae bacterium]|jgi:uncharacterized protein YqhQ|nr:DUF1385 domain-containing protein [Nitrospirota bacterium]